MGLHKYIIVTCTAAFVDISCNLFKMIEFICQDNSMSFIQSTCLHFTLYLDEDSSSRLICLSMIQLKIFIAIIRLPGFIVRLPANTMNLHNNTSKVDTRCLS